MSSTSETIQSLSGFVWSIAEILRGDFKQSEYGKVVLPFVVLRRLDCLLEDSKEAVLEASKGIPDGADDATRDMILFGAVGGNVRVYNKSRFTFETLKGQDPGQLHQNLVDYITKFSPNVRDIFLDKFRFTEQLKRLKDSGILWNVFERFCEIDLHPKSVTNLEMGYLFEELIRRFSEISNETAGEHFTPREVIRLIVDLLIANDDTKLTGRGIIRQVYDPACGTGGMLSLTEEALKDFNPSIRVELFGQELNDESFGICKSDMLVTGHDPEQIAFGNTLTQDAHSGRKFHYMLSNPPYGVDWKKYKEPIQSESENMGFEGRFGAGTPRVSDGQLLFLQHMLSKMRDDEDGSRVGIVMNGSPLFTGGAQSGESEIRRWMLENDLVEAIVALPTDLFYNTGIQTYVWLLTNRKPSNRLGKVQLIDASGEQFWSGLRKSLGSKRREIPEAARTQVVRLYAEFLNGESGEGDVSKIFDTEDFGYREIRVERPLRLNFCVSEDRIDGLSEYAQFARLGTEEQAIILNAIQSIGTQLFTERDAFKKALKKALRAGGADVGQAVLKAILNALSKRDPEAEICSDSRGNPEPDPDLRDYERVPLKQHWQEYLEQEVTPFVPDAWVDETYVDSRDKRVGRLGYEINFNKYFYQRMPPRSLGEIDRDLDKMESWIASVLNEVAA
ncbi:type I restriction-modification system subunit M [Henriciella marina]|uniref:type I restriction-modification system subunit M n=1 Tax=Henriciella marina TaxID=453851 RepID=UPI0003710D57|nr:class I SAM-dependent DNA methyltransferase [Henriciella marina]